MNRLCFSSVLLLVLGLAAVVHSFDASLYPNSTRVLPHDYTIYWRVDTKNNDLHLALKVKTLGWIGFGIGELSSGSMPGADIIMGFVSADGAAHVSDRWSSARALPDLDSCQDVSLVSGTETADGYTILEVTRRITTRDTQDRSIVPGPNRVIIAYSGNNDDTFAYHASNRQTTEITFYGDAPFSRAPVPDELTIDLRVDNFLVPDGHTHYVCQTFAVPDDMEYHITQIEPLVNESNVAHVHHFVAHVAMNRSLIFTPTEIPLVQQFATPGLCNPLQGQVTQGWIGMLSAWAAGGGSQYTPPEAGFPMGKGETSIKFVILEIHYNNPNGIGGYFDNSGIRLHYTKNLRQYEADVLIIGDPFTSFPPIPPNKVVDYEAECFGDCTQTFPTDLNVFGSFPHMHQAGAMAWSTQWRDNALVREIGRVEYFSYNHQQVLQVNFTVQRGDRFNTHCVFDTTGRVNKTVFGMASTDEMCMHFFFYYPRMVSDKYGTYYPKNFCGRFYGEKTGQNLYLNGSICGTAFDSDFNKTNPQHWDPPGGINKTFGVNSLNCPPSESDASLSATFSVLFCVFSVIVNFIL